MYTNTNYKTKKALREAVANGESIGVFQPGPFGGNVPSDGTISIEGPHYPQPHRWYAKATLKGGLVVTVG